tara:strand:- start:79 stop:381 length:303 start_codon:yes stop_codon:yes gene_type:complete
MMRFFRQDIKRWGKTLSDALLFLGEHAFVATLLFVLGAGVIAALLFWQYVIFSPQTGAEEVISEFEFQEELFEDILLQLKEEETRVGEADFLNPRDLFNP